MNTTTILIPHWNNLDETLARVNNAQEQSVPVDTLVLNWGKTYFPDSINTVEETLEQVVQGLSSDYVQIITPGASLAPTKIEDCLNAGVRPMYLDAQQQGDSIVKVDCSHLDRDVLEQIATGAVPLTVDAALFSRQLLFQLVTQMPGGLARFGRRILGGADRWLLLDAFAYADYPLCSERVSSFTPAVKETKLSSSPLSRWAIDSLLYDNMSFLHQRQADGFNARVQNSLWDWDCMSFLERELNGRILLVDAPEWMPLALPRCTCDTSAGVDKLPAHYEYYSNHFNAILTGDSDKDVEVWGTTLKNAALVITWTPQANWDRVGGIWFTRHSTLEGTP